MSNEDYENTIQELIDAHFPDQPLSIRKDLAKKARIYGKLDIDKINEEYAEMGLQPRISTDLNSIEETLKEVQPQNYQQTVEFIKKCYEVNEKLIIQNTKIENINKNILNELVKKLDEYHLSRDKIRANEIKIEKEYIQNKIDEYNTIIFDLENDKQNFQNKLMHKWFHYYDTQIEHINTLINMYENLISDTENHMNEINNINSDYSNTRLSLHRRLKESELDEQTTTKEDS